MGSFQYHAGQFQPVEPRERLDYGFFGPGSVTWKVWISPTSLIGFQRAVVIEHFDPFLTAAAADSFGIYRDGQGRYDRTNEYFVTVAIGDSRTVIEASEILMRIHADVTGVEPISGKRYAANNPESQLWIHLTAWHSILKSYEMFGPGPLSPEQEAQYWAECAIAAEFQTCDPADVPRSRDGVREYFAMMRPRLCTSERANEGMHHLLRTSYELGGPRLWAGTHLVAPATIATMPEWMRREGRMDQVAVLDAAIVPAMRAAMRALATRPAFIGAARVMMPKTAELLERHLRNETPVLAETLTPQRARELYGEDAKRRASAMFDLPGRFRTVVYLSF